MSNIEIKGYGNGRFQVWRDNKVLDPRGKNWLNDYHSSHEFMFFNTIQEAENAAEYIVNKENLVLTRVYEVKPA